MVYAPRAPAPVGSYPHARRAGPFLFLSGIGPRLVDGSIPGLDLGADGKIDSYDIVPQCHSVFANVREVLNEAGSAWENLLDITVFLIDIERDFTEFNRIYSDYFQENRPCRTTVEVQRLPTPIAIELKCIALL